MKEGQIFVIGDSHIGLADGNERSVNAWMDRLAAWRPAALYLNGDLFHYLIAHDKFRTRSVERVFERFRAARDGGMPIHYVEGNRDFFLEGSFVEDAVTDIALDYTVEAGTRKYLIVHGDLINDRDWQYRFWRRLSKNPFSKFCVNLIPRKTARRFVDGVERRLAQSNFKHKRVLPVEMMKQFASRASRDGFTDVILGHFHKKLVLPGERTTVTVLPPWFDDGEAMVIDPVTGENSFVTV